MDAVEITRRIREIEEELQGNWRRIRQPDDQPVVRGADMELEGSPESEKSVKQ